MCSGPEGGQINDVATAPASGSIVYAATGEGVLKTTNAGASTLVIDPDDRHTLFRAFPSGGVFRLSQRCLFFDGFETGDLSAWSSSVP